MIAVKVGSVEIKMNKNEAKELERLAGELIYVKNNGEEYREQVQRHADIWMRSAPTETAQLRRKAAVKALGLSDEIKFL